MKKKCKLILEDNSIFYGYSIGADSSTCGEVVFNTGMVGYPQSMTDPSYFGQILVFTNPIIGNYGVPQKDMEDGILRYFESDKIQPRGIVLSEYSDTDYHWNAEKTLSAWLKEEGIPGISGIDTRALTKRLRQHGTMTGKIIANGGDPGFIDPNVENLAQHVSVKEPKEYKRGKHSVAVVDCGIKNNILRAFIKRDITVIQVPWDYDFNTLDVDGIMLSNGPGDPALCTETIENVKKALHGNKPILGICLGSQILGLAAGAETYKLKYGHRGLNQPCMEAGSRRCFITSQNHGYGVKAKNLPVDWREWFYNLNDHSNEGIIHISKPFFGAQFHPEASPGPDDTEFIFDMFVRAISQRGSK